MIDFLRTLAVWLSAQPRFVRKVSKVGYVCIGDDVYGPDRWQIFHDPDDDIGLYVVRVLGPLVHPTTV